MCGGSQPNCFRYLPTNDTWVVSGSLGGKFGGSGYAYHHEFGFIITGGSNYPMRNKTKNVFDNMTIQVSTYIKIVRNSTR